MTKQNKHITVDDIAELQTLDGFLKRAKSDIKLHYEHALEVENGNVNRAIKRLSMAAACVMLKTAFDYAQKVQDEEGRGVELDELAMQVIGTLPMLSMIGYGVGTKLLTEKLDVIEKEEGR